MRFMMILVALLGVAEVAVQAGPPRRSRQRSNMPVLSQEVPVQESVVTTARKVDVDSAVPQVESKPASSSVTGSDDALDEVNAERAKRGLKPLLPDPLLNQAARTCAKLRAASHIHGHLASDFDHLPSGAQAAAAGCGALEPSWGWGTCCTYDNYTYGGAAWVMGSDGRRYMHLFVR
ncbi:MAG TPA: hypothetical protein PLX97_02350 [Gemmatales bacterium]|nr:hypothetical protein [Gemmatales bacterium]